MPYTPELGKGPLYPWSSRDVPDEPVFENASNRPYKYKKPVEFSIENLRKVAEGKL